MDNRSLHRRLDRVEDALAPARPNEPGRFPPMTIEERAAAIVGIYRRFTPQLRDVDIDQAEVVECIREHEPDDRERFRQGLHRIFASSLQKHYGTIENYRQRWQETAEDGT